MKLKLTILLFLLVLFCPLVSNFAQSNFIPAEIIKHNGDTIKGFIDYRDWDNNPKSIYFKEHLDSDKEKFFPRHLKSFKVSNQLYFSSTIPIIRSMKDKELVNRVELTSNSKIEVDTVFLLAFVIGKANLFYYSERNNQAHYFIETDSVFDELIYSKAYKNFNGTIHKMYEYREQLKMYLEGCEDFDKKIDKTAYTEKGLTGIIENYNMCSSDTNTYIRKLEKVEFQTFVLAGASSTKFTIKGASGFHSYLNKMDFERSVNMDLALALNIVFPRARKSISLYNELLFTSYKTNADHTTVDGQTTTNYEFGASILKLGHFLRYSYPDSEFRPFFNAGISNGISLNSTSTQYIKEIYGVPQTKNESPIFEDLYSYELSYLLGIGASYKRFSLELRYERSHGTMWHSYGYLNPKFNRFHLLFAYKIH